MSDSCTWLGAPLTSVAILGGAFLLFFVIERLAPLRTPRSELVSRLRVNASVSAIALLTAYLIVVPATMAALRHVSTERIGILQWLALSNTTDVLLGFALMDLSFYYW